MKKNDASGLTRRRFINTLSPLAVGCMGVPCFGKRLTAQDKPGFWREFPPEIQKNSHMRLAIDGISNVLRYAGNFGNFLGYIKTPRSREW